MIFKYDAFCLFKDEWSLFFHYIFPFYDVVRSTVTELLPSKGIHTKLGTHKVPYSIMWKSVGMVFKEH